MENQRSMYLNPGLIFLFNSRKIKKNQPHAAINLFFLFGQPNWIALLKRYFSLDILGFQKECIRLTFLDAFVQYRADFPIDLQKQVVFVDLAPIFSQMADVVLRRQIQLTIDTISEVIRSF